MFALKAIYGGLHTHAGLYTNPGLPFFVLSSALFSAFLFGALLLHELHTGKRALRGRTIDEPG